MSAAGHSEAIRVVSSPEPQPRSTMRLGWRFPREERRAAEEILDSLARYIARISGAEH
jgi:hypothetical protein